MNFAKLDVRSHPQFVLERILEYGDEKAVAWMKKNFTRDEIADILLHFRGPSPRSANYWAVVLGIDKYIQV